MTDLNVERHLKKLLINALVKTKGNRRKTAEAMGISERTVRIWIEKFDLCDLFPPHLERRLRKLQ